MAAIGGLWYFSTLSSPSSANSGSSTTVTSSSSAATTSTSSVASTASTAASSGNTNSSTTSGTQPTPSSSVGSTGSSTGQVLMVPAGVYMAVFTDYGSGTLGATATYANFTNYQRVLVVGTSAYVSGSKTDAWVVANNVPLTTVLNMNQSQWCSQNNFNLVNSPGVDEAYANFGV